MCIQKNIIIYAYRNIENKKESKEERESYQMTIKQFPL